MSRIDEDQTKGLGGVQVKRTRRLGRRGALRSVASLRGFANLRPAVALIAILALYLQVLAAAACFAAPVSGGPAAFPLCHDATAGPDQPARDGDHGPVGSQNCPLCMVHCQAAVAPPSPDPLYAPVGFVTGTLRPALFLPGAVVRFAATPPPRGPPVQA